MLASTKQTISWAAFLLTLTIIIYLSCISQPVSKNQYTAALDVLPIPETPHRYLLGHYKIGHSYWYAVLAVTACLCLKNRYFQKRPLAETQRRKRGQGQNLRSYCFLVKPKPQKVSLLSPRALESVTNGREDDYKV